MGSYLFIICGEPVPIPVYLNYTLNVALSVARVQMYTIKKDVLSFWGNQCRHWICFIAILAKISLLDRLVCFHKFFHFCSHHKELFTKRFYLILLLERLAKSHLKAAILNIEATPTCFFVVWAGLLLTINFAKILLSPISCPVQ